MFHSGFQMDYGDGSRTGKLVSYHMFKYTGQVCTSNCVFTVVHFSLFHYFLIVTPPTKPVCSHPISNMSSCCMYVLLNLVFWYIFINFVYGWVCVSNRLKVFWQVSQGVAAKSTVSSLHYQSSCSYICCISFFFSLFILFLFFLFPPKKKKPQCQWNALLCKTEHALPTLSLNKWSMWIY